MLEGLEGVGRVTTRKVLSNFDSIDAIRRYPREQVLNRLKGVPNAAKLVERLLDIDGIASETNETRKRVEAWTGRRIRIRTFLDADWPEALNTLPNPHRPNAVFSYGDQELIAAPVAAIIGKQDLGEHAFAASERLIRTLVDEGVRINTGLSTGFDVVALKLTSETETPSVVVASSGLARVEQKMRPFASQLAKAGGLMISSFPMDHGPFEHDHRESYLVQAAMGRAVVFIEPKSDSVEWAALEWALERGRAVFAISEDELPARVHIVSDAIDMEWVVAAVKHVGR